MSLFEPFLTLFAAGLLTAAVGFDRSMRGKPAGVRTHAVVGVGAAGFAYLSLTFTNAAGTADPARLLAQVASGIGWLGAGVIFASKGKPYGLTTAASLWASAAIGVAAGAGHWALAVGMVVVVTLLLWPLDVVLDRVLRAASKTREVHIVVDDLDTLESARALLVGAGLELRDVALKPFVDGKISCFVAVHGVEGTLDRVMPSLNALAGVRFVTAGSSDRELR